MGALSITRFPWRRNLLPVMTILLGSALVKEQQAVSVEWSARYTCTSCMHTERRGAGTLLSFKLEQTCRSSEGVELVWAHVISPSFAQSFFQQVPHRTRLSSRSAPHRSSGHLSTISETTRVVAQFGCPKTLSALD